MVAIIEQLEMEPSPIICPRCARREGSPTSVSGWCAPCVVANAAERYAEVDRSRTKERIWLWVERTGEPRIDHETAALRQQRKRLLDKMRPRAPVPPGVDPLELGAEALAIAAKRLRPALRTNARSLDALAELEELIRRLAWGPTEPD